MSIFDKLKSVFSSEEKETNSQGHKNDWYVFEWSVKDTGEIFYVGYGYGDDSKSFGFETYHGERIKEKLDVECKIIKDNLEEDEARDLQQEELKRVLKETDNVIINRVTPNMITRKSGLLKSVTTPNYRFEQAPVLYVSEYEQHYLDMDYDDFEKVDLDNLKSVFLVEKGVDDEIIANIYKDDLDKYVNQTKSLLEHENIKMVDDQFANDVTAWVYIGDDSIAKVNEYEDKAQQKLSKKIPVYHMMDVLKKLKEKNKDSLDEIFNKIKTTKEVVIHPHNSRVAVFDIKNLDDPAKGAKEGLRYWNEGEKFRKDSHFQSAIKNYDTARENGLCTPALYSSYASVYRSMKDYDNEIDILQEGIKRLSNQDNVSESHINSMKERLEKAKELLLKE